MVVDFAKALPYVGRICALTGTRCLGRLVGADGLPRRVNQHRVPIRKAPELLRGAWHANSWPSPVS